jgi:hypothetical protein
MAITIRNPAVWMRRRGPMVEVEGSTGDQNREVERREIAMQEQPPLYMEKGEVVHPPAHDEEANEVVIFHHCGWKAMNKAYLDRKRNAAHCGIHQMSVNGLRLSLLQNETQKVLRPVKGVEEDETRLGDQAVFKGDEDSTQDGSACAEIEGA